MEFKNIINFQLKRANPYPGLMIDADIWRDAHNYHRDQQRLHVLALHQTGIIGGLEVVAHDPPDLSVTINPGIGIDPDGNIIIVAQPQRYSLQTHEPGLVYLVLQFREVPSGPYQPPEGGQPTRIIEGYRIQERAELPEEPYLELARIDFNPADGVIKNAKAAAHPRKNEIDRRFRKSATPAGPAVAPSAGPAATPPVVEPERPPARVEESAPIHVRDTITLGHIVLGGADKRLHAEGLQNLIREIDRRGERQIKLESDISLGSDISRCKILYLTGNSSFELSAEQKTAFGSFLQAGGTIIGEGCSEGQTEKQARGAREFGLAFNQLSSQLECKLESVQRGHPLLSAAYLFSGVPQGAEPGMLLEGGHMMYSGSDYGCAWQGGHADQPLPRDIIRSSLEMGINIISYAGRGL